MPAAHALEDWGCIVEMEQTGSSTNTDQVQKQEGGSEEKGCAVNAEGTGGGARKENIWRRRIELCESQFWYMSLGRSCGGAECSCVWHIWGQCLGPVKIFHGVVQTLFSCKKNAKALKIALSGCSAVSFPQKCQKYSWGIVKTEKRILQLFKKYELSYSLEWQLKSSTHSQQCKVPVCLLCKAAIRSWKSEQTNRGSMLDSRTASSNTFPAQWDSLLNKGYSKFQPSQCPSCSCFKWKACSDF